MQQYQQPFNKVFIAFIFVKVLLIGYLGIEFFTSTNSQANVINNPGSYPTSLPWVETKSDCKHQGREWRDNKCWDSEHSMLF